MKSFYAFLKILEERREERRRKQAEERQRRQASAERKAVSPPLGQSANRFKRSGSRTKNSSGKQDGRVGLGLINVKPVIDKQIDGVYDLEVVDIHRQTFYPGSISHE